AADGRPRVTPFGVDFLNRGDGLGDLTPNERTKTATEAMHGHAYGALRHPERGCGGGIARARVLAREKFLEFCEVTVTSSAAHLRLQLRDGMVEQDHRPFPIEYAFGCLVGVRADRTHAADPCGSVSEHRRGGEYSHVA